MNDIVERKISGLTVKIERPTCIASENCINFAPDLFQLDEEGICAFTELKDGMEKDKIIEACSVCPVQALYVLDGNDEQLVP